MSSCPRCDGSGWIEYTGGEHWTMGAVSAKTSDVGPMLVEATPERPLYKRCSCHDEVAVVIPLSPVTARFE